MTEQLVQVISEKNTYIQFTTAFHLSYALNDPMTTCYKKNTSLIKHSNFVLFSGFGSGPVLCAGTCCQLCCLVFSRAVSNIILELINLSLGNEISTPKKSWVS